MILLKGVANSKYGTFLTAKMNIAAENLENAEPPHPLILFSGDGQGSYKDAGLEWRFFFEADKVTQWILLLSRPVLANWIT